MVSSEHSYLLFTRKVSITTMPRNDSDDLPLVLIVVDIIFLNV